MQFHKKRVGVLVLGLVGIFVVGNYLRNINPSCDDKDLIGNMYDALVNAGFEATLTDIYEVAPSMEEAGYTSLGIPKRARVCAVKVTTKNTSEDHVYAVWSQDGHKYRKGV
tara:strand:+ start:213 stop:545 length:333 start_codon:yes stop_codon:yes gene_type:complete